MEDALFGQIKRIDFARDLRASLPAGITLPSEVWDFIGWLEREKQTRSYPRSDRLFLPTLPVDPSEQLWSHLAFVIETDLIRHWFGKDLPDQTLHPLVRCGADGSHIAVWQRADAMSFVFLGSEGDAFTIAKDATDFITLITMGYRSIEDRATLLLTPAEDFGATPDRPWPDPVQAKTWAQTHLNAVYPARAEALLPFASDDPFTRFVATTQNG
ncbi:hypothetical protein LGQ03_13130 [Loktanella sp. TSTF-M6]|uniref:SMI1/KNR4 family protein n=1 Tax=Loktanella gaetbuli TaxID=2881335 RepID=A0ABS8BWR0_9RHOB|nr:hypothetical protein [Loktanella gaetbuli]MCB5200187.1 hypothetical protein [Loktanella gaetbuli]